MGDPEGGIRAGPASAAFIADVHEHPASRAVHRRNTEIAAERVKKLVSDGKKSYGFRASTRPSSPTRAATMEWIQRNEVASATGLNDAEAYDEPAGLGLDGVSS